MASNISSNLSNKDIHDLFISNHKGTTLQENYLLIILPLLLQLCHSVWSLNFFQLGWGDFKGNVLINFLSVVVPLIFAVTILSEVLFEVCIFLFILYLVGVINCIILSRATKYETEIRTTIHNPSSESDKIGILFISQVRGCALLCSAVCILAVDMKVFPRKWAKTEFYGTGVMDLGVGTLAILMGVLWPSCVKKGSFIRQLAVLFLLGTLRLAVVKYFDYNEHESEYGRHWNFFYTLAFIKIIGTVFTRITFSIMRVLILICLLGFLQCYVLQNLGYEKYCLDNLVDRKSSLLVANREGIISLFGYIILWLIGRFLSLLMKRRKVWFVCLTTWFVIAHLLLDFKYLNVSRRSANLAYVVWTSGCICGSFLVMFLGDVILNCLEDRANYVNKLECPDLYCIVNRRGLLHFVLANILTGLVNLSMAPHHMDQTQSVSILTVYTALPVVLIHFVDIYRHSNGHKDQ